MGHSQRHDRPGFRWVTGANRQQVFHKHFLPEPLDGQANKLAEGVGNANNLGKRTFVVSV